MSRFWRRFRLAISRTFTVPVRTRRLIVLHGGGRTIAVEVKCSAAPKVSKGFWHAYSDLGCAKGFVVYPGQDRYPITETVEVLPVSELSRIMDAMA